MTDWIVLAGVAAAGALVGAAGASWWTRRSPKGGGGPGDLLAVDFQHVLDLVRRVHGAQAACLVTDDDVPTIAAGEPRPSKNVVDRAVTTARQAMTDGRDRLMQDVPEIVAVGDGRIGAALILPAVPRSAEVRERIVGDLRRIVGGFRVGGEGGQMLRADPQKALDGALTRLESVEGLATALCEAARSVTGLPTAIVLRDRVTHAATIVAVSRISDHRLVGNRVTAESACGRALMGQTPVAGATLAELVGAIPGDRRRRDEPGIAFPLNDGRAGIGALVVFGQPGSIDPVIRDRIAALAHELSPHLSAAADVRAAETRALTDELTGLPNRRLLEQTMNQIGERPAALLVAQVDHFKTLSDGFGHAGSDAALKHVGQLLARTLRDGDLAARSGDEEFALWLVGATQSAALEVAGRIRKATAASMLRWAGTELKLTCSIGVACYPEPVPQLSELRLVAGAASRRARDAGGDRVEIASPSRTTA